MAAELSSDHVNNLPSHPDSDLPNIVDAVNCTYFSTNEIDFTDDTCHVMDLGLQHSVTYLIKLPTTDCVINNIHDVLRSDRFNNLVVDGYENCTAEYVSSEYVLPIDMISLLSGFATILPPQVPHK